MPRTSTADNLGLPAADDDGMDSGPIDFTTGAINWDNVSTTFEPLPAGLYAGTITEIEDMVGQTSGQPYLSVTVQLNENNRRAWYTMSFSPNSLFRVKRNCLSLGVDLSDQPDRLKIASRLRNLPCVVKLGVESYKTNEGEDAKRNTTVDLYGPNDPKAANLGGSAIASNW